MKPKKILAIITVICMLMSMGVVFAAEGEHIQNGSFENLKDGALQGGWACSGGTFGIDFLVSNDAKEGSNSLEIKTEASSALAAQSIPSLVEGKKYKVSLFAKIKEKPGKSIAIKMEFRGKNDAGAAEYLADASFQRDYDHTDLGIGTWKNITFDFTAPKGVVGATILLRLYGGGNVLYDAVSIVGEMGSGAVAKTEPKIENKPAPVQNVGTIDNGVDYAKNGSFEKVTESGSFEGWNYSGGKFGTEFLVGIDAKEGTKSLQIKTEASSTLASQSISMKPGKYSLSFWVKVIKQEGAGPAIKFDFLKKDANGNNVTIGEEYAVRVDSFPDLKKNEWQQKTLEFTAPEGTASAVFLLRLYGAGEVLYDDVKIIGAAPTLINIKDAKPIDKETKQPVAGAVNLVKNSDMEKVLSTGMVTNWDEIFANDAKRVSLSEAEAHSGKNSIVIKNNDSSQPWARQSITENLVPDGEYTTTAWVKTTSPTDEVKFKWEFRRVNNRTDSDHFISGTHSDKLVTTPGVWTKVVATTRVPEDCVVVDLYIRLFGEGEVYFDDVEFYLSELPPKMYTDSDVFYYTEWGTGKASVTVNDYYGANNQSVVDFVLRDGDKVLEEKRNIQITNNYAEYEFSISKLTEIGKEYFIDMIYKDISGNIIDKKTESVYRYNRPTIINEEGLVILDGKEFVPVLGYHVPIEFLPRLAEAGVNTVQSYHYKSTDGRVATSADIPYLLKYLDEANKYNIKVLVVLYPDMLAAGHPKNVEKTNACVTAVKDHPAVLGYMVLDEPYNRIGENGATFEDINEWCKNSYKIIHDIDPKHVVYSCNTSHRQEMSVKYVDVFCNDPYPINIKGMAKYVSNAISGIQQTTKYRKPVWCLNLANSSQPFTPDGNAIRHEAYQALFAGSKSLGWYNINGSASDNGNLVIWEREGIWQSLNYFVINEQDDAIKHFVLREYPMFNGKQGDEDAFWYRSFVKNGELYVVVLNQYNNDVEVTIPLTSYDGKISLGEFKAEADTISGQGNISGNGSLNFSLKANQVVRFKVTPAAPVDFSSLKADNFVDLANYPWAKDAINFMAEKNITNFKGNMFYVPSEKITRADFAYFLIRTLGLKSEQTENFADINADAYYAKELAIGKALGILKGIGDNMYNPYDEISRQDMMTICARGMRYSGKLGEDGNASDVSVFTDSQLIADYALTSIAAMVREKIVLGNADKTVNPLGNATRSEAAVIMSRILNLK